MGKENVLCGIIIWIAIFGVLYIIRPQSAIHKTGLIDIAQREKVIIFGALIATILTCTLPMSASPYWNGEIPDHRNQYEVLAESILKGHLYIDYGDMDPRLEEMDNPYDRNAREELGINYHWDHAYYNGHYYMYFGVVPVFLLFIPYRIITGSALVTYHATQLFAGAAIIGIFALFYEVALVFAKKISYSIYLFLSIAFSFMSVWYSATAPALYCTAIVSAICMEVWSLFFFVKAVWREEVERKQIIFAFIGATLGALTFGCRPPVALANLLVIPMLVVYIRKNKINFALIRKLALAAMPYIVIGILLMLYNYVRFENPFEFGQAYQLTGDDQHLYGSFKETYIWYRQINLMLNNFIYYKDLTGTFPYISYGGVFVNFPILLLIFVGGGQELILKEIKNLKIGFFVIVLALCPFIITFVDALWAPSLGERYRMDIYFLMALLCFLVIVLWYETISDAYRYKFAFVVDTLSVFTVLKCCILFIVPNDANLTTVYPELLEKIQSIIFFWV